MSGFRLLSSTKVYTRQQQRGLHLPKLVFEECELDHAKYELRRAGRRVKLEKQPFEILLLLLERPGELFTREEIRNRLWSKELFLDAEQGINNGIRKIRVALGDDIENPRYIETVVGRGYRFKAQIRDLAQPNINIGGNRLQVANELDDAVLESTARHPTSSKVQPRLASPRSWWASIRRRITVGIAFLVCTIAAFLMISSNARQHLGPRSPGQPIQSLAVLPLANFSGDPSQEYFVDGMTDELITNLAQVNSLRVVSRTSIMRYKNSNKPLRQIANDLQADAVVEGSVTRSGDQVRITAQLIDARDDRHLWARSYQREASNILQLQGEVSGDIAQQISSSLSGARVQLLTSTARTPNSAAYRDYLKGRYSSQRLTNEDLVKGIGYFEQSIQEDPNYAPAYTDLSIAYTALGSWFGWLPPAKAYPKAKAAALRALSLDPNQAEAHSVLGWLDGEWEWNWAGADQELRLGVKLNPNSSFAHSRYAIYLVTTGQSAYAVSETEKALQLDPLSPLQRSTAAYVFICLKQYDRAIKEARRAIEADSTFADAHVNLATALGAKSLYQEAFAEWLRYLNLSGDGDLAQQLMVASKKPSALSQPGGNIGPITLRYFQKKSRTRYVTPLFIAGTYLTLGDKDRAIEWLEKAYKERSPVLFTIKVDPNWDPLRSDTRFQNLLRRMDLPADANRSN